MALPQHWCKFLFARILEGSLVGILDLGGSILTGIGIGVPAIFLSMGIKAPVENFGLALLTGALLGLAVGGVIVLIRKFTINQGNSTFGADVMMGAGNASGRFLGPLIILSAAGASIPIGIGATLGALGFTFGKPIAGGAILGAMILVQYSRFLYNKKSLLFCTFSVINKNKRLHYNVTMLL